MTSGPAEFDDLPDDIPTIKEHLHVRREAVRMMMEEITVLTQALRIKLGPAAWVVYLSEQQAQQETDMRRRTEKIEDLKAEGGIVSGSPLEVVAPNRMCACGVLVHPDMPTVVADENGDLWHFDDDDYVHPVGEL